ncbi:MAG: FHS family L-fucose permease-like MFS transporter [Psychromonas sp.]|jgi:FHS family L-fucose permease-like MFS transporter
MSQDANALQKPTNYGGVITLTSVFFFWGFIAAGNSVFIPFCKSYFHLDQFQSQLIDFAFYLAYYLGALGLFVFGSSTGRDLVTSWGYKKSIVYGLIFSALGAGVMILSVYKNEFNGMLMGLFVVALGFSLQQTSANPFMISLGDEERGSSRINLGGAVNSLGTTIGPLIVSLALFGTAEALTDEAIQNLSLSKVIVLYSCVGLLFLSIAVMFGLSKKVPSGIRDEKMEKAGKAMGTLLVMTGLLLACFAPVFSSYRSDEAKQLIELEQDLETASLDEDGVRISSLSTQQANTISSIKATINEIKTPLEQNRMKWLTGGLLVIVIGLLYAFFKGSAEKTGWGAMQYPQLTLGMLAIFIYVGVEVALASNLGELLKLPSFGAKSTSEIAPFVAMFWGSLMIGRWTGALNAFDLKKKTKNILRFVVPLLAFTVVLTVTKISGYEINELYWYVLCVLVQIGAFFLTKDKPAKTLFVFGLLGIVSTFIGVHFEGQIAIYGILSAGLCCSIMWPCIFSLSLAGLGKYQAQGAGFLVMMILGGAIIPPLQGKLSDIVGIQPSYLVSLVCFVYLVFFAFYVKKILKKQNLNFE